MVPLERILNLNAYSANKQTNKQINKWFPSENAKVQVNQQKKKKPP